MTQTRQRDRNVARVMLAGYVVIGGLMILAAWVGITRIQPLDSTTGDSRVQAFGSLLRLDGLANDAAQELNSYLVAGQEQELRDFRVAVERLSGESAMYAGLARLSEAVGEREHQMYGDAESSWSNYLRYAEGLVNEYQQHGSVSKQTYQSAEDELDTFFSILDQLIIVERADLVTIRTQREALLEQTELLLLLVAGVALVSLIGVGTFVIRRVTRYVGELQQSDADLELRSTALDSTHVGICYTDATGNNSIAYANEALERITGYPREELVGKTLDVLQGVDTDPETVEAIHAAISEGREINAVILNYRKDGRRFWNELYISPVRDPAGNVIHFVGVMHDVTERRELESQLQRAQKMEAVGQLAGGVAHDFNNYLTVINGNAEVLALNSGEPKTRAQARQIIEAGNRSASLTRHLLAFSRRQVMVPQTLDLNRVINDLNPLLRRTLGERIHLETITAEGLGLVNADESQIEQVLLNLVVNARDAMPEGGQIRIETRNADLGTAPSGSADSPSDLGQVMFAVSDTGTGIPEELRERIFEPFFSTKEGAGSGLGLSTVIGIVEQSGGTIRVQSNPGGGTQVEVYLPRVIGDVTVQTKLDLEPATQLAGTVLVVEDEAMVREITCQMVRNLGLSVLEAEDGQQGLELMQSMPVDALLTDVMLPGMDGLQLADKAVELLPGLGVVYMSGYAEDGILHNDRPGDGIHLLEKPFTEMALKNQLAAALSRDAHGDAAQSRTHP